MKMVQGGSVTETVHWRGAEGKHVRGDKVIETDKEGVGEEEGKGNRVRYLIEWEWWRISERGENWGREGGIELERDEKGR